MTAFYDTNAKKSLSHQAVYNLDDIIDSYDYGHLAYAITAYVYIYIVGKSKPPRRQKMEIHKRIFSPRALVAVRILYRPIRCSGIL